MSRMVSAIGIHVPAALDGVAEVPVGAAAAGQPRRPQPGFKVEEPDALHLGAT